MYWQKRFDRPNPDQEIEEKMLEIRKDHKDYGCLRLKKELENQGIHVNMTDEASIDHDGSVLDYSRLHDMTIQAWSPYQYGFFEGVFIWNEKFPELNQTLEELAAKYQTTPTGLASAWILRHPANMQVIAGTMNVGRIKEIAQASEINMSREDWYELYRAAGNILP